MDSKITDLAAYSAIQDDDVFAVVDVADVETKKIAFSALYTALFGTSIDVPNRQLIADDDTTIALDWSDSASLKLGNNGVHLDGNYLDLNDGILYTGLGQINGSSFVYFGDSIDTQGNSIYVHGGLVNAFRGEISGFTTINGFESEINYIGTPDLTRLYGKVLDSSNNLAIDPAVRQLIGSNGTEIILDWSSSGHVNMASLIQGAGVVPGLLNTGDLWWDTTTDSIRIAP